MNPNPRTVRRTQWLGYGACAAAGCLWGTGFFFGRIAMDEMSVEYMVLYRFLFACVGLLPVALMHRVRLTKGELRLLVLSAGLGVPLQFLMQFHGLAYTTVSHASLMVGTLPVLLAAAAALFMGERLDWVGWLALCGLCWAVRMAGRVRANPVCTAILWWWLRCASRLRGFC